MKAQIEMAKEGVVTEAMMKVAKKEGFDPERIRQSVAKEHIVIPVHPSRPHM